ncbi:hypothetical protein QUF96_02560 [Bacillus bombysepticus]|nr:hypothetical protein [Bacillus bombysepticus]
MSIFYMFNEKFEFEKPVHDFELPIEVDEETGDSYLVIPSNCTDVQPPVTVYGVAIFNPKTKTWSDTMTEEEWIKQEQENRIPTTEESLGQQVSDLEIQLMEHGETNEQLGQQVSDLEIDLVEQSGKHDELGQTMTDLEISLTEENEKLKEEKDELGQQLTDLEIKLMELEEKIDGLVGGTE